MLQFINELYLISGGSKSMLQQRYKQLDQNPGRLLNEIGQGYQPSMGYQIALQEELSLLPPYPGS